MRKLLLLLMFITSIANAQIMPFGMLNSSDATPVAVAPDAPTNVTAKAGDTQATVTFTAPANDGGSEITGYRATSSPGAFTGTLDQAAGGSITVSGLTNGTAYTFTVTAINSLSIGVASAASNPVTPYQVPSVTSSTGQIWMDRNLGATQVATSSTDYASYGDLYQWGRGTDGHQIRTSEEPPRNRPSSSTSPSWNDGRPGTYFIKTEPNWYIGTDPSPNSLWQGVNGINNPCPCGYRLPTQAEWEAERATWSTKDAAGAFASPLKLPLAGMRSYGDGSLFRNDTWGYYWSQTVWSTYSVSLDLYSSDAETSIRYRASGSSVRCIKEVTAPDQ